MRQLTTPLFLLGSIMALGCPLANGPIHPVAIESDSLEPIEDVLARTLAHNRTGRLLSAERHGAWQILHGMLAYGDELAVDTPEGPRPALRYLLEGGTIQGFEPLKGDSLGRPQRPGLRILVAPGTKIGQGHRDQWLAVLAQCDLPIETQLRSGDHTFTIGDWLRQAEYDVPRNLELEFSWSLIALTAYRDTDHRWTASDGNEYSTELLLECELEQDIRSSGCGGTHRLIGIAMSLGKRRSEGKPIGGVWADAQATVADAINSARQNQNPDGSYSADYHHRPGWTRDLGQALGTTGHVVEFLALAASNATLQEPWVQRSVRRLCQILDECREIDLECGSLYHALHGLSEYQRRIKAIND